MDVHNILFDKREAIDDWLNARAATIEQPLFSSIDIRDAGFKVAHVDANLFPCGFNNLGNESLANAKQHLGHAITTRFTKPTKRILVITESQIYQPYYIDNLIALRTLLLSICDHVEFGILNHDIDKPTTLEGRDGDTIIVHPIERNDHSIQCNGMIPDIIILNNDFATGANPLLEQIETPMLPPMQCGWYRRYKSTHFDYYQMLLRELCDIIKIDPVLLSCASNVCHDIDYQYRGDDATLADASETLLAQIATQYDNKGITDSPFVMLKPDSGSYGLGVIPISHASEIENLNRKQRKKLSNTKGGVAVHRVLLQEGITSHQRILEGHYVAEPVIYSVAGNPIGGFYRYDKSLSPQQNLNAKSAQFLPFEQLPLSEDYWHTYCVIARLASLACGLEIAACQSDTGAS